MPEALHERSDTDLRHALAHTGRRLVVPTVDVDDVVQRLRTASVSPAPRRLPRRVVLLVAVLTVLGLATAVAASLGVPGIVFDTRGNAPAATAPLAANARWLGDSTTLDKARARASFPLLVPRDDRLPVPEVRIAGSGMSTRVSLLYRAGPALPALGDTDVGLVITQFAGAAELDLLTKTVAARDVEQVRVRGMSGLWIPDPHAVALRGPDDGITRLPLLAEGRTLIFTEPPATVRIESDLPLEDALHLAEALR